MRKALRRMEHFVPAVVSPRGWWKLRAYSCEATKKGSARMSRMKGVGFGRRPFLCIACPAGHGTMQAIECLRLAILAGALVAVAANYPVPVVRLFCSMVGGAFMPTRRPSGHCRLLSSAPSRGSSQIGGRARQAAGTQRMTLWLGASLD